MNMKIEIIPPHKVAYIRRIGPYGVENRQTMERLKHWAKEHNLLQDESIILGIAHDNPPHTKPENCRYDTCFVLSDDNYAGLGEISIGKIVGGNYIVFTISHTAEALQKAWSEVFGVLLQQGYELDETRPIMERYVVEMVFNHFCEICVPIK